MTTFEKRCKIKDIEVAKKIAGLIGGTSKGYYFATDVIFKSTKAEPEKGVILLRKFNINNRQTKNFVLTQKTCPEWTGDKIKADKIIIKERFDKLDDAINFIVDHYGGMIEEYYSYSRNGWEYHYKNSRIFIEDIEILGPTIEIESENIEDLENLFKNFETTECFSEPVNEIIRKLLKI